MYVLDSITTLHVVGHSISLLQKYFTGLSSQQSRVTDRGSERHTTREPSGGVPISYSSLPQTNAPSFLPPSTISGSAGPVNPHSLATTDPGLGSKAAITSSAESIGIPEKSWDGLGRTALHGLRSALQIAAESADALLLLKSAVGGVWAVVQTCEVSSRLPGSHHG